MFCFYVVGADFQVVGNLGIGVVTPSGNWIETTAVEPSLETIINKVYLKLTLAHHLVFVIRSLTFACIIYVKILLMINLVGF